MVILGIGGAPGKILRGIAASSRATWIRLIHLDTDTEDQIQHEKIQSELVQNEWVKGQGCGGDSALGENATRSNIGQVKEVIKQADLLLVVACLGKGTGSGGVQVVSRLVKEENILTFFFVTFPFAFEGNNQLEVAQNALKNLRNSAEVVIAIQNDLLFTSLSPNQSAGQTFEQANQIFADSIMGIAELVRCRGLLSVDFSSLKSVLTQRDAFCSIGIGKARGDNKIVDVIDNLFQSPMLGGQDFINKADVVIATLIGGESMSIGEMQQCLSDLNTKLNTATKTIIGANVVAEKGEEIQISMLAIHFQKNGGKAGIGRRRNSNTPHAAKKRGKRNLTPKDSPYQLTLPFGEEVHSLGIFSDSPATVYQGQNLDIPTFLRLGINLDLPEE